MKLLRDPMVLLLACLALAWGVHRGIQPPKALPSNVSQATFSAGRAKTLLRELYPGRQPHVSGSPENAALRDRIVSVLKRSGYRPEVQRRFHCKPDFGSCSPVENILAVRKGTSGDGAILLTAHYDSAWAGPGIADDGAGVAAVLEIARMVRLQPEFAHDLIILLTDAEEQGMLGADAFARHHPLFPSVRAVINLEARGVSGPSIMFETGKGNRDIIDVFAQDAERPVANSLTYEVYRRLPNYTDFSVYRMRGLTGVNFAFTRGAAAYHSRIDDLKHLDSDSLQHHGENGWAMLLALDEQDLGRLLSSEDAVYTDLFGRILVHFPTGIAPGLALLLSVVVMVAVRRTFAGQIGFRQVVWASLALLMLVIAVPAGGWLLSWPLGRWVDMHPLAHPYPWPGSVALLMAVLWLLIRVLRFLSARASVGSVTITCWGFYVLLAGMLSLIMPEASYLALFPMLGFSAGLVLDAVRWKKNPRLLFAGLLGFLSAAYIAIYYFLLLEAVVNLDHSELRIAPLLLPAIAALPLLVEHFESRTGNGAFAPSLLILIVAACVSQQFIPGYTPDSPRDMSLMLWQTRVGPQAWLVLESVAGAPDQAFARNNGFNFITLPAFDGEARRVLGRAAEPVNLPEIAEIRRTVRASPDSTGSNRHSLELSIPPNVRLLSFRFPQHPGPSRALVDGQVAFVAGLATGRFAGRRAVTVNHPPAGKHRFEFDLPKGASMEMEMTARFDLPEEYVQPFEENWPENAQPAFLGPRILQVSQMLLNDD